MTYYVVSRNEGEFPELSVGLTLALEATLPPGSKIFKSKEELLDWLEDEE